MGEPLAASMAKVAMRAAMATLPGEYVGGGAPRGGRLCETFKGFGVRQRCSTLNRT
jgi:hypothetical protein